MSRNDHHAAGSARAMAFGLLCGAGFGLMLGTALDDLAHGMLIGLPLGLLFGAALSDRARRRGSGDREGDREDATR